jgi:hypothetical protein
VTSEHLSIVVSVSDGERTAEVNDETLKVSGEEPRFFFVLDGVSYTAGKVECVITRWMFLHV